jgi:hypothetical protein
MINRGKKKSAAHASGMRGHEPFMGKETAEEEAREAEGNVASESSELQDSTDLGTTVGEHIHRGDEIGKEHAGHHFLNLTTLGEGLKKGGKHDA